MDALNASVSTDNSIIAIQTRTATHTCVSDGHSEHQKSTSGGSADATIFASQILR